MMAQIALLFALILLNGLFAMSEMAIVSARRARLIQLAESGRAGAKRALELASDPTRFFSSVQVGITSIGILSGAIGEAAIATRLQASLEGIPPLAPYAHPLSLGLMVLGLTYVSLIVGELAPKRFALTRPEAIASLVARPMHFVARIARPIVYVLSMSTDTFLRLIGVRPVQQPVVTHEEIQVMLQQGTEAGIFERVEQDMVTNVLSLDERHVSSVMTPRADVVYLDVRDPIEVNRLKLRNESHTVLPLCDGGLDNIIGIVRASKIVTVLLHGQPLDLVSLAEPPLFVPETMTVMKLLEQFKRTHLPIALVVNEFGDVEGLVSLADVVSSIVGELPLEPGEEPAIVRRADGSWLVDGSLDVGSFFRDIGDESRGEEEERRHYHTVGGLAMMALGRIPRTGDVFQKGRYRFEVMDMDGNRVDRVLVSRVPASGKSE